MLINAYKGKDKCLKRCNGQHNTKRPNKLIREVIEFFNKHLAYFFNIIIIQYK